MFFKIRRTQNYQIFKKIKWVSTLISASKQFSQKTLTEFKKMLKPNGVAVFVSGEVAKSKPNKNLERN